LLHSACPSRKYVARPSVSTACVASKDCITTVASFAPYLAEDCRKALISGGLEPPTFCVLDRCDNRYTTRSPEDCITTVASFAPYLAEDCRKALISGGLEPPTFCVLDRCDNRYTTRSPEVFPLHRQFQLWKL
uniref:FZ domain-containing protein n=1 Tax=Ascaris lumbricoides TaxID=6252 RepID=A0A0M3IAE7_ASCLU